VFKLPSFFPFILTWTVCFHKGCSLLFNCILNFTAFCVIRAFLTKLYSSFFSQNNGNGVGEAAGKDGLKWQVVFEMASRMWKRAMSCKVSGRMYSRPNQNQHAHGYTACRCFETVIRWRSSFVTKNDVMVSLLSSMVHRGLLKTKNRTPLLVCCTCEVIRMPQTSHFTFCGRKIEY